MKILNKKTGIITRTSQVRVVHVRSRFQFSNPRYDAVHSLTYPPPVT
jgi:hypothetical protein